MVTAQFDSGVPASRTKTQQGSQELSIPKNSQGATWTLYVLTTRTEREAWPFGFLFPSRGGSTPFSRWPAADAAAALANRQNVGEFPEFEPILDLILLMSAAPTMAFSCCPCTVMLSMCFKLIFLSLELAVTVRGEGERPLRPSIRAGISQ